MSNSSSSPLQRQMTAKVLQRQSTASPTAGEHAIELDWEEYDGTGSFLQHCLAGSFAGVAEHTLMYPFDTLKTVMQAYCADCPQNPNNCSNTTSARPKMGMLDTLKTYIHGGQGPRLWRGVQSMMAGCIPAHALYFSSYEFCKSLFLSKSSEQHLQPLGSAVAGATAAFCHDVIMTPADVVKQRLQLGHYSGMQNAFTNIMKNEGVVGFYRSFPITLLTNLPYGIIMVTTNEYLRNVLTRHSPSHQLDVQTTMLAGCGAGAVAAAVTTPLDRCKTRLQTQGLVNVLLVDTTTTTTTPCDGVPAKCPQVQQAVAQQQEAMLAVKPKYQGLSDAFTSIVKEEGWMGLFRGMTPRLMTHTPAIAISWTTYEAAKLYLLSS